MKKKKGRKQPKENPDAPPSTPRREITAELLGPAEVWAGRLPGAKAINCMVWANGGSGVKHACLLQTRESDPWRRLASLREESSLD
jgi:hypothetical protein